MIKFVISDYNWLDPDLTKAWFNEFTSDYLILDKFHRLKKTDNIIWQKNVGQNVYDMFDYIVENYDNLPKKIFFCRACITFPQGRSKPLSNGNCSLNKIRELINKPGLVEVNNYSDLEKYKILNKSFKYLRKKDKFQIINSNNISFMEKLKFKIDIHPSSFCNTKEGYLEINNNWYIKHFKTKFFRSFDKFMINFFENYKHKKYIRFSPGCNYIVPSENIYKYPKDLYYRLRSLVDYAPVVGEAHILERALYYIFNGKLKYKAK